MVGLATSSLFLGDLTGVISESSVSFNFGLVGDVLFVTSSNSFLAADLAGGDVFINNALRLLEDLNEAESFWVGFFFIVGPFIVCLLCLHVPVCRVVVIVFYFRMVILILFAVSQE